MSEAALLELLLSDEHPAAVLLVDDGRVTAANAAAAALLGSAAAAGADAASLFDEGSRGKLAAALASSERGIVELQSIRGGREPLATRLRIEPIGSRRLVVVVGTGPAYTAHMEALLLDANARLANLARELSLRGAELTAANDRFRHMATLREDFTAALSHDIRGPLTAILLAAATHERSAATATADDIVRRTRSIKRNVEHALRMVHQILDVAHIESGALALRKLPVSLVAVARDVAESVSANAASAGVRVEVRSSPVETELPRGWVAGEPVRLFSILSNLVGNAIRHSPAGGVVRIDVEEDEDVVRCAVRDQGPGVPPDLRERIFERFRQGDQGGGSVGLGLYIVRQLVGLHGGRVWVEDATPSGAAFVCELPRIAAPSALTTTTTSS